ELGLGDHQEGDIPQFELLGNFDCFYANRVEPEGTKGQEENPTLQRRLEKDYSRSAGRQCVWFQKSARSLDRARERRVVNRDVVINDGRLLRPGTRPFIDAL